MTRTKTILTIVTIVLLTTSAGCSTLGTNQNDESISTLTSKETESPTEIAKTEESTPTAGQTASIVISTPEPTEVDPYSERRSKYEEFDKEFRETAKIDPSTNISTTKIFPANESYHVRYVMNNPENKTISAKERRGLIFTYSVIVDDANSESSEWDHTWIPDTVNVTAVTPDGEVYETAYIKYIWAYKVHEGSMSLYRYVVKYAGSLEGGPAGPNYQDN
ncbi:hypothetical protein ACOZ4I_14040 [Haloarcula salina]|uniref:hypothetical protein n=1 Tax=Haloarcula salina TaxID=1429914 RepID=UPI003C6EFA2B